jgi:hypothetical protein
MDRGIPIAVTLWNRRAAAPIATPRQALASAIRSIITRVENPINWIFRSQIT